MYIFHGPPLQRPEGDLAFNRDQGRTFDIMLQEAVHTGEQSRQGVEQEVGSILGTPTYQRLWTRQVLMQHVSVW